MNITFLGLGNMGSGIAGCLLRAGHSLRVWNRTTAKISVLPRDAVTVCASPAEAVQGVGLVISSLIDDAAIRAVFDGPDGAIAHMMPNAIHLGTSTILPDCADWLEQEHRSHGSRYVSGCVVGRPDAAAQGTLLQFLSGDTSAITEVQPVCQAFASTIIPIPGRASVANKHKLAVNFFIISLIEVMAECLTFTEKMGASPQILTSFFDRALALPGLKGYAHRLLENNSDGVGGFSMRGGLKDVNLMLDAAKAAECPLDLATLIQAKMREVMDQGLQDADWSAIQRITRTRAGLSNP